MPTSRSQAEVLTAIDQIYAASCDASLWSQTLTGVADLVGAGAAHLLHHDYRDGNGGIVVTVRTDPAATTAYVQHYHRVDPWALSAGMAAAKPGDVLFGHELVPRQELLTTEFYAGIGRPYGTSRALIGTLERSERANAVVSFNRGDRQTDFSDADRHALRTLMPHFRRALRVRQFLGESLVQREILGDVLERLDLGVVLLDASGRVTFANMAARRLSALADGFQLGPHGPEGATPVHSDRLRAAIATSRNPEQSSHALTLPRPSSRSAFEVLVLRLPEPMLADPLAPSGGTVLLIRDSASKQIPDPEALQTYFGLTPAEARFGAGLASGLAPQDLGDELRLTRSTTRWFLERLRAKTGAQTQAQTVTAFLTSLARIRRD